MRFGMQLTFKFGSGGEYQIYELREHVMHGMDADGNEVGVVWRQATEEQSLMTTIGTSTKWGRIRMEFPDEMGPEDRARLFEEMAKVERAPKTLGAPRTGIPKNDLENIEEHYGRTQRLRQ